MDQAKSARIARDSVPVEKFTLTLDGEGLSSTPIAGEIEKNTEVTIKVTVPENNEIDTFTVGGVDKKSELVNNEYKFKITADTEVKVTYKDIPLGVGNATKEIGNEGEMVKLTGNSSIEVELSTDKKTITIGGEIPKYTKSILGHELNSNLFGIKITLNSVNKATAECKIDGPTKDNEYKAEDHWMDGDNYFYFVGAVTAETKNDHFVITIDNDGNWTDTTDQISFTIGFSSDISLGQ